MDCLNAGVADAVEMDDEAVRHVVVEGGVVAGTCRVRPLPGEAHFRRGIGCRIGARRIGDRSRPRRAIPGF